MLDELRILIESTYHESQINVQWDIQDPLPLVWADRYGLDSGFLEPRQKQPASHDLHRDKDGFGSLPARRMGSS